MIYCHEPREDTAPSPFGLGLTLFKENRSEGTTEDLVKIQIGFEATIERPDRLPIAPQKPFCLLSVRNSLEVQVLGELLVDEVNPNQSQPFLARTSIRLPVGWECIEVYPFFEPEVWKSEFVPIWAEIDLLAAVVAHHTHETQFQTLDSKAAARQEYAELLKSYKALLDSNPEHEEILHQFLKDHPELLCPTHIKMWSKLPLGARETDFVFEDATGEYLLVELERSTLPLFKKDGDLSKPLDHARKQIVDWKRYLEDNLSTAQHELSLTGISANPRSLIVIGRSQDLTPKNKRLLTTMENESPKTKIMTYDHIYENAKAVIENLFGPLWETPSHTKIYYLSNT